METHAVAEIVGLDSNAWHTRYFTEALCVVERGDERLLGTDSVYPAPYLVAKMVEDMANVLEAVARNNAGAEAARAVLARVRNPAAIYAR
jgi:hypothetical protein